MKVFSFILIPFSFIFTEETFEKTIDQSYDCVCRRERKQNSNSLQKNFFFHSLSKKIIVKSYQYVNGRTWNLLFHWILRMVKQKIDSFFTNTKIYLENKNLNQFVIFIFLLLSSLFVKNRILDKFSRQTEYICVFWFEIMILLIPYIQFHWFWKYQIDGN